MTALSDHIRRDAGHAARSDIRVEITKYLRRLDEAAQAYINTALAAEPEDEEDGNEEIRVIDGTELGREAARVATAKYLSPADVHEAIEAGSNSAPNDPKGTGLRHRNGRRRLRRSPVGTE